MPRVFISHNHQDKSFVRRLGADLAANGVRPLIDEAEINVGDSLISKIGAAIDELDYFAIVLSPRSIASVWVQQELEQAMTSQLASRQIVILPILLEKCEVPAFLRGKLYVDFTQSTGYDESFARLLRALGVEGIKGEGGSLYDPSAREFGRHISLYSRPVTWHCIFCGWKCVESFNDYICKSCNRLRLFAGGSATMVKCDNCKQMNLALATFCEWCGIRIGMVECGNCKQMSLAPATFCEWCGIRIGSEDT
jgi:TIR domain